MRWVRHVARLERTEMHRGIWWRNRNEGE